uniref:Uncharacterized protein n=1 Tax=Trichogramma kaykai TaxID=54128 RepID=A0ABD2XJY1_9HYME
MKFQERKIIRIVQGRKMESSDILYFPSATIKEELSDVFNESDRKTFDEAPEYKNFQLLAFQTENSTLYESELDDEVEIVAECEDVKPEVAKKIDDDFEYHLQSIKYGDSHNDLNTIEVEAAEDVIQKCYSDTAEETNFNFNCEYSERRITRSITKTLKNERNLKRQMDAARNAVKRACNISRKKLSSKDNLKTHVDATSDSLSEVFVVGRARAVAENREL